jgi:hypothetical protein
MNFYGSATCPNCQTDFDRLALDGDEDGNCYVVLPVAACATCGVLLCPCCEQFTCECGQVHCAEHVILVPDGTPKPLKCCGACASGCEPLEVPLAPAAMCPDCGSLDLVSESFDHGMEAETGYRDAGELFRCLDCGARGPAEDAEFQPAPRFGPQRQTVPTIAAKADVV